MASCCCSIATTTAGLPICVPFGALYDPYYASNWLLLPSLRGECCLVRSRKNTGRHIARPRALSPRPSQGCISAISPIVARSAVQLHYASKSCYVGRRRPKNPSYSRQRASSRGRAFQRQVSAEFNTNSSLSPRSWKYPRASQP